MNMNRQIKLNRATRGEIADNVRDAWLLENPRPFLPISPAGQDLKDLENWKTEQVRIRRQTLNALDTFSSVNQLEEMWPAITPFVPGYLVNPEKNLDLPKKAA